MVGSKFWMQHKSRMAALRVDFLPGETRVFVPEPHGLVLNSCPGWCYPLELDYMVDESSIELVLYHIRHVWANNNEESYRYIMSWLADLIQNPGRKCGVALVIRSTQGTGKQLILDWFGENILGDMWLYMPGLKLVTGDFNAILAEKLLVNLDEVGDTTGPEDSASRLKTMIASRRCGAVGCTVPC